jgi:hypothetical protein
MRDIPHFHFSFSYQLSPSLPPLYSPSDFSGEVRLLSNPKRPYTCFLFNSLPPPRRPVSPASFHLLVLVSTHTNGAGLHLLAGLSSPDNP